MTQRILEKAIATELKYSHSELFTGKKFANQEIPIVGMNKLEGVPHT